jgi:hypothetical protein
LIHDDDEFIIFNYFIIKTIVKTIVVLKTYQALNAGALGRYRNLFEARFFYIKK